MSILEKLYNGQVYPFENIVPQDKAYRAANRKICEIREYFSGNLSLEDKETFEEMNQLLHESTCIETYENFTYGFRLGVLLMCDVFMGCGKSDEKN